MDPKFWRQFDLAREIMDFSAQLDTLRFDDIRREARIGLDMSAVQDVARQARDALAFQGRPFPSLTTMDVARGAVDARRSLDVSLPDSFVVEGVLDAAQTQYYMTSVINTQDQLRDALGPTGITAASQIATHAMQTSRTNITEALRQIRAVGPETLISHAVETLRSPLTGSLIEQANTSVLSEYAETLAHALPDDLADRPMSEDGAFDWIFELDKASLRTLCRVLINIVQAFQIVAGIYTFVHPGIESANAMALLTVLYIMLTKALEALEEKDE